MAHPNETIVPQSTQGESFKSLLSTATGKDYADIGEADVERWASGQGWRQKDVKRIVKGFTKFSKRDSTFNLTAPGEFRVEGASGSGRRKGNVKGFDVGDIVGLGRDVSLLGGALETVQTGGGEEKVAPGITGGLQTEGEEVDLKGVELPDFERDFNLNSTTASGAGATQVAGQTKQQVQKDRSPKQVQVPEGEGDIAFSPSQVFQTNPFLQRQGLGLLNTDPNDFGGNVKLGDALISGPTPKAKKPTNIAGKEITDIDASKEADRETLINTHTRLQSAGVPTSQSGKDRLAGMKRDFNRMLKNYQRSYGEGIDTNYYETTPFIKRFFQHFTGQTPEDLNANIAIKPLRFGGKTKFSR